MAFGKIVVQSTSRISLNDRFSRLRGDSSLDGVPGIQQRRQAVQATRKNQRLAQQMEQRPAVIAALRGNQRGRSAGSIVDISGGGEGLLRSARGARGTVRVGSVIRGANRPVRGTSQLSLMKQQTRGRGRGRGTYSTRGLATSMRGASARGSIRGINFKTGAPMRTRGPSLRRGVSTNELDGAVSVKSRLAVQSRLSQPTATRGWIRGGFQTGIRGRGGYTTAAAGYGRGSYSGRGAPRARGRGRGAASRGTTRGTYSTYHTRTFRGRGRGRGFSNQWEDGY